MPADQVKAIAKAYLEPMSQALHVSHWKITLKVEKIKDSAAAAAQVFMTSDYDIATIVIDPTQCNSEEEVVRFLRHELIHLLLAPFDLHSETVREVIRQSETPDPGLAAEARVFTFAVERMVLNIERALDYGLKYQPWKHPAFEEVQPLAA